MSQQCEKFGYRRVAIVVDGLACGGAETQAIAYCAAVRKMGRHADLVSMRRVNELEDLLLSNSINPRFVEGNESGSKLRRIIRLARILRSGRYDVVHGFKRRSLLPVGIAGSMSGAKRVLCGYRDLLEPSVEELLLIRAERFLCHGWVALSEAAKLTLMKYRVAAERIFVVYNSVDPLKISFNRDSASIKANLGIRDDQRVITIIAKLRKEKNHEMFVRVAMRLTESMGHNLVFLVAGDGPENERLRELTKRLAPQANIRFLGRVNDVAKIYSITDVAVITSDSEGLCSTMIESGLCGIPAVSTDCGGVREVIMDEQTGFLVPKDDDQLMAERIRSLLMDRKLYEQISWNAKNFVLKRFSAQKMAAAIANAYKLE